MLGMGIIVGMAVLHTSAAEKQVENMSDHNSATHKVALLEDFGDSGQDWHVLDDGVMGGISHGQWKAVDGMGIFEGTLSLENGGGFSSVRSQSLGQTCEGATGFRIRVRGDGRTYQFRVWSSATSDGASYRVEFPTEAGVWKEVVFPLERFEASFRGRIVKDYPPLLAKDAVTIGFLLADKKAGDFRLEVDWIEAVGER